MGANMKFFNLTLSVSANPNLTEEELLRRFEAWLNAIPKETDRILFKSDIALVELKVEEKVS